MERTAIDFEGLVSSLLDDPDLLASTLDVLFDHIENLQFFLEESGHEQQEFEEWLDRKTKRVLN